MWPAIAGAIIGGGLSYLGNRQTNQANAEIAGMTSAANAQQAHLNRMFQGKQAVKARNFERNMSNSAWRRGVHDMEKAGLNPMLAFSQGGASTPNTGIPSGSSAQAVGYTHQNELGGFVSSASAFADVARSMSETELIQAQARKTDAEGKIVGEAVPFARELQELSVVMKRTEQQIQSFQESVVRKMWNEGKPYQVEKVKADIAEVLQEVKTAKSHEDLNRAVEKLRHLDVPRGVAFSDYFKSEVGRASPYLDEAGKLMNSAGSLIRGARTGSRRR